MLSLDSSFQNSRRNRTSSITNVASSDTSPHSSKSGHKGVLSSKSIERNNRTSSSTRNIPTDTKTPPKYNAKPKHSPSPMIVSKKKDCKRDLESEIRKGLEAMKKKKNEPTKSTSKPLSSRPVSSNTSLSNVGFSDLRRTNYEKLNESIDSHSQSISEMTESWLTHSRDTVNRKNSQSNFSKAETRSLGLDQMSLSSKSGKNSLESSICGPASKKGRNDENTVRVMQNVYAVKTKPLGLNNLLRPSSRPRNGIDEQSSISKRSSSKSASKENNPKVSSGQKSSVRKEVQKSGEKNRVKKADLISCRSLLTDLGRTENSKYRETVRKDTEEEKSYIDDRDYTVKCNGRENENRHSEEFGIKEQSSGLGLLKQQLQAFTNKLQAVTDSVALREKRTFFIRLLEILHQHKLQISQSLIRHESEKRLSLSQTTANNHNKVLIDDPFGADQILEEINMQTAISFHNLKLVEKYFYQGFLGYYVLCKLGETPAEEAAPPVVMKPQTESVPVRRQSFQPSHSPLQQTKKHDYSFEAKSQPGRSKSPVPTRPASGTSNKMSTSTVKKTDNTKSVYKSSYGSLSPNQSFTMNTDKSGKKTESLRRNSTSKNTRMTATAENSRLDYSFGETSSKTSTKRLSAGHANLPAPKQTKSLYKKEDLVPDQILTNIPQPMTKEGLDPFDTPRTEERAFTLGVENNKELSQLKGNKGENLYSKAMSKNDYYKPKEVEKRQYGSRDSISATRKRPEPSMHQNRNNYTSETSFVRNRASRRTYTEDTEDEASGLSEIKLIKALEFRKTKLLNTYGRPFINTLVDLVNNKLEAVWYLRIRGLMRRGFLGFYLNSTKSPEVENEPLNESKIEEAQILEVKPAVEEHEKVEEDVEDDAQMKHKMRLAKYHYETTTKANVFNAFLEYFIKSYEENNAYEKYRETCLLRSCFVKWFETLPESKKEKEDYEQNTVEIDQKDDEEESEFQIIADKFRFIVLAEKAMRQLKAFAKNSALLETEVTTEGNVTEEPAIINKLDNSSEEILCGD